MDIVVIILTILTMAVVVDRADLLFEQISKSFRPLRDALIVAGLFYVTKKVVGLSVDVLSGTRIFGLSKIFRKDFRIKYGQWAVVTGCTRGIGKAYVHELAKRKMDILLVGRSLNLLNELKEEVASAHGVQVEVLVADFAQGSQVYETIKPALENKDIGILVNNVGVITEHPMFFTEATEEFLWEMVNINVASATLMCRIVLPSMESRGRGAIINLASSAALHPQPLQAVYTATKAYVDYFSEALSYEAASKGVTVQTINPLYVCTAMTGFSDMLNKPSLFIPSPETFASHAIQTLGVSSRTTGYWAHSLQLYLSSLVPRSLYIYGSYLLNQGFRKEALNKKRN